MRDLIASEGPAILGYVALIAVIVLPVLAWDAVKPIAGRYLKARRDHRHTATGCLVCIHTTAKEYRR